MTGENVNGLDAGFDARWKHHPRVQATTEGMLWQKTGWTPDTLRGLKVLDYGCGCGRFARMAGDAGALVTGIDGSPHALAAARENAPDATLVQGDLLAPTLEPGSFDAAFSIGVLHHTSDPPEAFAQMSRLVKPGGRIACWVYCQPTTDEYLPVLDMFHEITRNVPADTLHDIFARYAPSIRDLYAKRWEPLMQIVRVSNSMDNDECISDTHDWHACRYRFWHDVPEVKWWFKRNGCVAEWVGEFPTSVSGRKL